MSRSDDARPRRLALAGICALLCVVALAAVPILFGTPRALVYIEWRGVDDGARGALEDQFGLTEATQVSGGTWSYLPSDTSSERLAAIVANPAVADTSGIDQQAMTISASPPLTPRRGGLIDAPWLARIVRLLGAFCGVIAVLLFGDIALDSAVRRRTGVDARYDLTTLRRLGAEVVRERLTAIGRAVTALFTRGIPDLSADALGLVRIVYAGFLFWALVGPPFVVDPGNLAGDWPRWPWIAWLAGRPDAMAGLEYAVIVLLVLFAAGLCARLAHGLAAAGLITIVLVWCHAGLTTIHVWLVCMCLLVCLLPVPWHHTSFGLDEWIRRRRQRPSARGLSGKAYGYAVWAPGLILGSVWASAAYSKVEGGPEWILGGAVQYHWVIDAAKDVPVDWGLWIATQPWAAVLMSFFGVFFEAIFIFSVFSRPAGVWRPLFAATGIPLLIGFYLFHGVLWWPWWLAYLLFVIPWAHVADGLHRLAGGSLQHPAGPSTLMRNPGLGLIHGVLIAGVCIHASLELPEGFGRFGSYSNTYASHEAFDEANVIAPVSRLWVGFGSDEAVEVRNTNLDVSGLVAGLDPDQALPAGVSERFRADVDIQDAISLYRLREGPPPVRLVLTRQRRTFDWDAGRYATPDPPQPVVSIDLDTQRFAVEDSSLRAAR